MSDNRWNDDTLVDAFDDILADIDDDDDFDFIFEDDAEDLEELNTDVTTDDFISDDSEAALPANELSSDEIEQILRDAFADDAPPFSWKKELLSWVIMFVCAFAIAFVIDHFFIVNATVPTGSMQNTIMAGDRMIGWRLSYKLADPERGDVIIFNYPDDPKQKYVKRVIGLPGETVTITNSKIYINDSTEPLAEDYLPEEWVWKNDGFQFVVPEDCYFVLGDNRNNSHDARSWTNTYVTRDAILGEALFCYWPLDRIKKID